MFPNPTVAKDKNHYPGGRTLMTHVFVVGLVFVLASTTSLLGLAAGAHAQSDVTLTVSVASDLTLAFEEVGDSFEDQTGIGIEFNFGSTGQLAQQIQAGAPVDVFAAANVSFIDQLAASGLILPDTQALYARGRIVLWTRADSALTMSTIDRLTDADVQRIAIANPDHAPYGAAAREALRTAGIWDAIQDKLVLGENISDTMRYAESGNVDVAIVALSLAIPSDGTWTLIPEELHSPLDQALAVIASTEHEAEAREFAAFVGSELGRTIMRRFGFVLPGEAVPGSTPANEATPSASPATG